jgi:hypothetical protein
MSTQPLIVAPQINCDLFLPQGVNGGVYGLNWDFKDGSTPSTLTIQIVSENGQYNITEGQLSYNTPHNIRFGSLNFNGYLTDFSITASAEQKTLTLEYTDFSADLDRYYVGLYGRWGYKTDIGNHLIIVGKAYHPCDAALASTAGADFASNYDACDPCPFMPRDKFSNSCGGDITHKEALIDFKISEVFYTFNDLLNEIGTIPNLSGIQFLGNAWTNGASDWLGITGQSSDMPFRSQATGTIKSVLNSWCNDLGLAWYWDPFANTLNFVSRSQPITIDPSAILNSEPLAIDFKYGVTKKGTFARGFSGYFSKEGVIKNYKCELDPENSFVNLKPITFADLIGRIGGTWEDDGDYSNNDFGDGVQYDYLDKVQISTALSYYHKSLRDSFLWFGYYGICHGPIAKNNGSGYSAEEAIGSNLIDFGNMNILEVYSSDSSNEYYKKAYEKIEGSADLQELLKDYQGQDHYYFVATYDSDLAQEQYNDCKDRASNLLGKYWFTPYETPIPGGSNTHTNLTVETSDGGSGNWYISQGNTDQISQKTTNVLSSLPLLRYGFSENSPLAQYIQASSADDQDNSDIIDSGVSGGGNYVTGEVDKPIKSFILGTRNAQWWPSAEQARDYSALYDWYDYYMPKTIGGEDGRPAILKEVYPDATTDSTVKLFIAREYPNTYQITLSEGSNDLEPSEQIGKIDILQDVFGNPIKLNRGPWGLTNNNAWTISILETSGELTSNPMNITLPVGAFSTQSEATGGQSNGDFGLESSYYALGDFTIGPSATEISAGNDVNYTVFVKPSQEFKKVLPKIEYIHQKSIYDGPGGGSDDVEQVSYHYKEIKEDNLKKLGGGKNVCIPDQKDINSYINGISTNCAYTMSQARKKITYKVPGVNPSNPSDVANGLSSVNVSLTSNGFFTSYSLEDKIVLPPSDSFMEQMLIAKTLPRGDLGSSYINGEDAKTLGRSYPSRGGFNNVGGGGGASSPPPGSYM